MSIDIVKEGKSKLRKKERCFYILKLTIKALRDYPGVPLIPLGQVKEKGIYIIVCKNIPHHTCYITETVPLSVTLSTAFSILMLSVITGQMVLP